MPRNEDTIEKVASFMGDLVEADRTRIAYAQGLGVAAITAVDQELVTIDGLTVEGWDRIEDLYEFLIEVFPSFE